MLQPARTPLNHSPMLDGEVKLFEIDKRYTECQLKDFESFYVSKYEIKEGQSFNGYPNEGPTVEEETYAFFAFLDEKDLGEKDPNKLLRMEWISYILCREGTVGLVETPTQDGPGSGLNARKCGLATLLSYLCMKDGDVRGFHAFSYSRNKEEFEPKIRTLIQDAAQNCRKVILFQNIAVPEHGALAYINAAMDAHYGRLYTFFADSTPELQSFSTFDDLPSVYKEYKANPDEFVDEYGLDWFFCERKVK